MSTAEIPIEQRLWMSVEKGISDDACWLWVGSKINNGYGVIRKPRSAKKKGTALVHRVSYEIAFGPIPDGLDIDHKCRVRNCVNPNHLRTCTRRQNTLWGIGPSAKNAQKTHCLRGHPLEGENILIRGNRRCCRECIRIRARKHAPRRKRKPKASLSSKQQAKASEG